MLSFFDPVRGMDYFSVLLRLLTAALCGAAIGIERSMKNRPAGFRTHILVCLGGAVAAVTAHFIYLVLHLPTDVTRLGGQVITGLGFIGAGTIIVTKKMSIKGLTTAAGLWTTGIIGLAAGSGFYEGALLGSALVLLTESTLARLGAHQTLAGVRAGSAVQRQGRAHRDDAVLQGQAHEHPQSPDPDAGGWLRRLRGHDRPSRLPSL